MGSGYGGDGGGSPSICGSQFPYFYRIFRYIYIYEIKIFYETMKYKKMNDGIFKILRLHGKYFLWVLLFVKIIYMGLEFL